jgi:hypothetical protein
MLKYIWGSLAMYGLAYAGRNPAEAHFEEPKKSEKLDDAAGRKLATLSVNDDAQQDSPQNGRRK